MPSTMATITEAKPTSSDNRVPYMIEDSTSLPWSSVPSGKIQSPSSDTRTGARNATTTIKIVAAAAITVMGEDLKLHQTSLSVTRCSQPGGADGVVTSVSRHARATLAAQPRIDGEIEQIDGKVDQHEEQPDQQQISRHHRDVGELHRLDEELSDARPGEHRLRDDGEGDQGAELQARHGDHRHQRVLECMAEIDGSVGEAASARELDVVGAHHLQHFRAYQTHDQGELEQAERDRR